MNIKKVVLNNNNFNCYKSFNMMYQYLNYQKQILVLDAYKLLKQKQYEKALRERSKNELEKPINKL